MSDTPGDLTVTDVVKPARSQAIDDCIKVVLAVPDFTEFVREGFAEALRRFKASEALKEAK